MGVRMGDSPGTPGLILPKLHPSTNTNPQGRSRPGTLQLKGREHPGVVVEPNLARDGAQGAGAGEGARPQHAPVCPSFASLHLPGGAWS